MSFTPANLLLVSQSALNWSDIPLTINDATPDPVATVFIVNNGTPYLGARIVKLSDSSLRLPRLLLPQFVSLLGGKANNQKAYIAINVDLINDVVVELTAVDESGAGGGGHEGQARIAGTVTIDGTPAARDVIVISDDAANGRKVLATGSSDGTGAFDITYDDWDGAVIALAMDQYGSAFVPSAPINLAAVIHPTVPNGYVYEVTGAGTTGATEPVWSTTGTVESGSVTFNPRPYYRPVASGPLQGEIITPP